MVREGAAKARVVAASEEGQEGLAAVREEEEALAESMGRAGAEEAMVTGAGVRLRRPC